MVLIFKNECGSRGCPCLLQVGWWHAIFTLLNILHTTGPSTIVTAGRQSTWSRECTVKPGDENKEFPPADGEKNSGPSLTKTFQILLSSSVVLTNILLKQFLDLKMLIQPNTTLGFIGSCFVVWLGPAAAGQGTKTARLELSRRGQVHANEKHWCSALFVHQLEVGQVWDISNSSKTRVLAFTRMNAFETEILNKAGFSKPTSPNWTTK